MNIEKRPNSIINTKSKIDSRSISSNTNNNDNNSINKNNKKELNPLKKIDESKPLSHSKDDKKIIKDSNFNELDLTYMDELLKNEKPDIETESIQEQKKENHNISEVNSTDKKEIALSNKILNQNENISQVPNMASNQILQNNSKYNNKDLVNLDKNYAKRELISKGKLDNLNKKVDVFFEGNKDDENGKLNDKYSLLSKGLYLIKITRELSNSKSSDLICNTAKKALNEYPEVIEKLNNNENFDDKKLKPLRSEIINELVNCKKHLEQKSNDRSYIFDTFENSKSKVFEGIRGKLIELKTSEKEDPGKYLVEKTELVDTLLNLTSESLMKSKKTLSSFSSKDKENLLILQNELITKKNNIYPQLLSEEKGRNYIVQDSIKSIVKDIKKEPKSNLLTINYENLSKEELSKLDTSINKLNNLNDVIFSLSINNISDQDTILSNVNISKTTLEDTIKKRLNQKITVSQDTMFEVNNNSYLKKEIKELGAGTFAKTYKYENKENNDFIAVKEPNIEPGIFSSDKIAKEILIYKDIMGDTGHKNITSLKGINYIEDKNNLYIGMELAKCGDLKSINEKLEKCSESDKMNVLKYIFKETVEGIEYINNERGMVHSDIKPDNILLSYETIKATSDPNDNSEKIVFRPKIADFGLSEKRGVHREKVGSPGYFDPYIATKKVNEYDSSQDIWALGASFSEIAFEKLPNFKHNHNDTSDLYKSINFDSNKTTEESLKELCAFKPEEIDNTKNKDEQNLKKLINSMTIAAPNDRASITEILNSDFLKMTKEEEDNANAILEKLFIPKSNVNEIKEQNNEN